MSLYANPKDNLGTSKERDELRRVQQGQVLAQRDTRTAQRHFRWGIKSGDINRVQMALIGLGANKQNQESVIATAKEAPRTVNALEQQDEALGAAENIAREQNKVKVVQYGETTGNVDPLAQSTGAQMWGGKGSVNGTQGASTHASGTGGQTTPSSASTAAGGGNNGKPVDPLDPEKVSIVDKNGWDTPQKFAADLLKSAKGGLLSKQDETAYDNAVKRGADLGVNENKIHEYLAGNLEGNPVQNFSPANRALAAKADHNAEFGVSDKGFAELMDRNKVTPEQRKMFAKLTPQDRKTLMADDANRKEIGVKRINSETNQIKIDLNQLIPGAALAAGVKPKMLEFESTKTPVDPLVVPSNYTDSQIDDIFSIPEERLQRQEQLRRDKERVLDSEYVTKMQTSGYDSQSFFDNLANEQAKASQKKLSVEETIRAKYTPIELTKKFREDQIAAITDKGYQKGQSDLILNMGERFKNRSRNDGGFRAGADQEVFMYKTEVASYDHMIDEAIKRNVNMTNVVDKKNVLFHTRYTARIDQLRENAKSLEKEKSHQRQLELIRFFGE